LSSVRLAHRRDTRALPAAPCTASTGRVDADVEASAARVDSGRARVDSVDTSPCCSTGSATCRPVVRSAGRQVDRSTRRQVVRSAWRLVVLSTCRHLDL